MASQGHAEDEWQRIQEDQPSSSGAASMNSSTDTHHLHHLQWKAAAGTGTRTPPGVPSRAGPLAHAQGPKLLTPPKVLAVLMAAVVAVLFRNFFLVSSPAPPAPNFPPPPPPQSASLLVETITTTVTNVLPVPTKQQPQAYTMSASEQTFIAIKPDGVQRGLVGPIISRFEQRGYKLVAIKLVTPPKEHLEAHYADLKDKPFFPGLLSYMLSGPICAMVWEGRDAVKTGRVLLGATNPLASAPGTIRGDYSIDVGRNVCHGSDSVENAKKEIALWFKEGELVSYKASQFDWIYEKA